MRMINTSECEKCEHGEIDRTFYQKAKDEMLIDYLK